MAQESRLIAFEQALKDEGIKGTNLEPVARSIFQQESSSGANVKTSNAGARGPMQVLPATFKAYNPQGNIDNSYDNSVGGLRYIKDLFNKTGDLGLTAVGYYGGPKAIEKAKQGIAVSDPRNPNAPNTLQYREQVMGRTQGTSAGKPTRSPVPKAIQQVAPELGPNYQAALALMAKADDLSDARERIAQEEEDNTPADFSQARQMLAQIKPVTGFVAQEPRRMAGGGEASSEEFSPSLRFQSLDKPKDDIAGFSEVPQGMMGRVGGEYRNEGSSYRAGASAVAVKLPDGSIKIIPAAYDVGYSTKVGPGQLELSGHRSIQAQPGRGHDWGARVNYRIPIGKAEGGFVSIPNIQTPILSSKDKAKRTELETQLKKYDADIKSYNEALEKYNTEIYNPYKIKTEEYNRAAEEYNKLPVQQYGGSYVVGSGRSAGKYYDRNYYNRGGGMYIPRAPAPGDYLGEVDQYNTFTIKPGYYFEDGYIKGKPGFTLTAPIAPDPFNMTAPTAPTTQEEIDKFITQAQATAQRNAQGRQIARSAVQDPSRFNFGSVALGDLSGFGGTSTQLFAEGGEAKKESPSMGESVKGTAKEILRSMQYAPYDLLGAPVDVINLGLKGVDYVTGSKLATDKPVGGSDYLIQKSRELGIADQPTGSTTETLTRLGTGIVSPTAGPRAVIAAGKAAKGTAKAALEDLAMAGTGQGGSKLAQKIMEPGTAFAVRPKGGVFLGARSVDEPPLTDFDLRVKDMVSNLDKNDPRQKEVANFLDKKVRNYLMNQQGTVDDPIFKKLLSGDIQNFTYASPEVVNAARAGDKAALEEFRNAYDASLSISALVGKKQIEESGKGGAYALEQALKKKIKEQSPDDYLTTLMASVYKFDPKDIETYPSLYGAPGFKQFAKESESGALMRMMNKTDLPPHVRRAIAEGEPVFTSSRGGLGADRGINLQELQDYLLTRNPNDIKNMGFADAVVQSKRWHEMLEKAATSPSKFSKKELFAGTEPVKKLDDEYSWVDVKTKEALAIEGCIMGHCVGRLPSYAEGVLNGTKKIYSLRDKKGIPHVTVEVNKTNQVPMYNWDGSVRKEIDPSKKDVFNQIAQVKGKANTPAENYFPQINEFLTDYSNKIGEQPQITELPRYVPENWRYK